MSYLSMIVARAVARTLIGGGGCLFIYSCFARLVSFQIDKFEFDLERNKTPAQAFTPPADKKKMGTIWIFVYYAYYAVYGSGRGRDFLVLKWGGLNLQIWDLNRAHETERTVFPILQVFSMCRHKLSHERKHKGYSTNSAMNTL